MNYYRWPCGVFESMGDRYGWSVWKNRPMPCTPAGDLVARVVSKEVADKIVAELNDSYGLNAAREYVKRNYSGKVKP